MMKPAAWIPAFRRNDELDSLQRLPIRAVERGGVTLPELWAIDRRALDVAFADEATLAPIRSAFDSWAVAERDSLRSTNTEATT